MKILLIYTPRSGSTSLLKYFKSVKKEYKCYNEPWFGWMIKRYGDIEYDDLILDQNIFVKSTISNLPVSIDQAVNDFDKVIFLLRRDIEQQVESIILVNNNQSFLDSTKRIYDTSVINDGSYESGKENLKIYNEQIINLSKKYNKSLYYYEDLYYKNFESLFNELDIIYDKEYFEKYLDIKNRYRINEIIKKNKKTLL